MKNAFLIILNVLFFLMLVAKLPGQYWNGPVEFLYHQESFMPDEVDRYIKIDKVQDTLYKGKDCGLFAEYYIFFENGLLDTGHVRHYLLCYENNQVLVEDVSFDTLRVVYDFSLEAGDTLETFCTSGYLVKSVIEKVTVEDIGGQQRKVQHFREISPFQCRMYGPTIEGIGNFAYLFPQPEFVDPPPGGSLSCFKGDGIVYPQGARCTVVVPVKEVAHSNLSIYPNPTSGVINFEKGPIDQVRLYNLFGQLLTEKVRVDRLDLSFFKNGIYLIHFEHNGKQGMLRVVRSN